MNENENDRFPVLIERHLKMKDLTSNAFKEIVVEIGSPYWKILNVQAACPVAIHGLIGRVNDISSIDPLAAMKEAIKFVEKYLEQPPSGVEIYWPDGEKY